MLEEENTYGWYQFISGSVFWCVARCNFGGLRVSCLLPIGNALLFFFSSSYDEFMVDI